MPYKKHCKPRQEWVQQGGIPYSNVLSHKNVQSKEVKSKVFSVILPNWACDVHCKNLSYQDRQHICE